MKHSESGQALPLGIALLLAGFLTGVVIFNTGQVVNEKTRLANAADAAVYSGITWQARALNFNAYTNRAMVANQVAMAQAVSLQAWAEYARTTTANLSTVLIPVPVVGQIAQAVNRIMAAIAPIVSGFGTGILAVVDPINSALSTAQEAMYLSAFVASPQIVENIAAANDTRISSESAFSVGYMANNLRDWSLFTDQFEPSDEQAMDERVAMINASTDKFTNNRSWEFFKKYIPVNPLLWFRIDRSGSTRLLRDKDTGETEWKAIDTLSLNSKLYYWFGRFRRAEVPIGYAMKYANDQDNSIENCTVIGPNRCEDWFGRNRLGQRLARNVNHDLSGGSYEPKTSTSYRGVRAYRSLANDIRRDNAPNILMRTELRMATNDIRDSQSLNVAPSIARGVEESDESVLSSVSSAEVFFNRPEDDLQEEYASGYNPFWAVRLAPTTNSARIASMTLRGSGSNAVAVGANLAVFSGEGSVELPADNGAAVNLPQWLPSSTSETVSSIGRSGDLMEEVLTDVLDDVLARIMQGLLPGGISSLTDIGGQALAGVDMDNIDDTVNTVNSEVDELRERYHQARIVIQQEFAISAERLMAERDSRVAEINQSIAELEVRLDTGTSGEARGELELEIAGLVAQRDGSLYETGVDGQFREALANDFVDIVGRVLPEWPLTYRQALEVIEHFLSSDADVVDQINIIELPNSEDDLNE